MVELDKTDSAGGGKDMPPPDALGSGIQTSTPDEETRAATETLKALQRQKQTAGLPENSSLLTPPSEADYLNGNRLMDNPTGDGRSAVHLSPSSLYQTHWQVQSLPYLWESFP